MTELPRVSDISLRCSLCKSYLTLASVESHKKYHKSMRIMRYKTGHEPYKVEVLAKRHKSIVTQLLQKYPDASNQPNLKPKLDRINDAFEFLRAEITRDDMRLRALLPQDGMSSMREGYLESRDKALPDKVSSMSLPLGENYPSCVTAFGRSFVSESRKPEEDSHTFKFVENFGNIQDTRALFIGMYDGYHGNNAAKKSEEHFHGIIAREIEKIKLEYPDYVAMGDGNFTMHDEGERSFSTNDMFSSLKRGYTKMDEYLSYGVDEKSRIRWSGTSAMTMIITEQLADSDVNAKGDSNGNKEFNIFAANAGDVRAVLYHHGRPYELANHHSTFNNEEKTRIKNIGGVINGSDQQPLVYGVLKTTRGLGNHGNVKLKKSVINLPYTCTARLNDHSQIIVLATDAVWKAFNHSDVLSILLHAVPPEASCAMMRHGPTPITPILHKAPQSETPEIFHNRRMTSSELPSIVETDEDEIIMKNSDAIAEVVIVEGRESTSIDSESDFEDYIDSEESFVRTKQREKERLQSQRNRTAQIMSEQLVRATVETKVTGNISVSVILLNGFFR